VLAAGRYDDGRPDVPGGLAEPVERVVVIGAGIAGLTVANALAHGGVDCVVLEARDRIGGRLHTIELAGVPVDMGGSWIHHPIGNPLRAFAAQVGVDCPGGDPLPELSGYDCVEGRRLTKPEVEASLAMQFEAFPEASDQLRGELGPDASVAEAIEAFVVSAALEPDPARRARQALRAIAEADASDSAERHSLRWLGTELEYGGDFFGDLPTGGYRSLVDAMAAGVDVRLGVDVAEVALSEAGVRVHSNGGAAEDASHVVVAVPLGVLKRGAPHFAPALAPERRAAIAQLGFGRYEKIVLRFEQPFWRDADLSHLMLFTRNPDEPTIWVFDLQAFDGQPALACHIFHSATPHVLEATADQSTQWILSMLGEAVGTPCPAPIAVAVSGWATDQYAGGGYTHLPPGADPAQLDLLGEPIGGRILFAGEHTQSARVGYADGAMTSGIREAKRLLQQPSIALG
jgi:polyamine oxidase